jgi:hypothetical protein
MMNEHAQEHAEIIAGVSKVVVNDSPVVKEGWRGSSFVETKTEPISSFIG